MEPGNQPMRGAEWVVEAAKERGRERGSMVAYVFARGLWEGVLAGLPGLLLSAGGLRHR